MRERDKGQNDRRERISIDHASHASNGTYAEACMHPEGYLLEIVAAFNTDTHSHTIYQHEEHLYQQADLRADLFKSFRPTSPSVM
jgi:hypothetical protein